MLGDGASPPGRARRPRDAAGRRSSARASPTIARPLLRPGGCSRSRFVALILAYQVLSALGSQLSDFLVFDRATAQYPATADLARFLAGYTAVMNVVTIAFLFVLAGPLLRRFGLRLGIAANPFVLTIFAVGMIVVLRASGGGARWPCSRSCRRPGSPTSR